MTGRSLFYRVGQHYFVYYDSIQSDRKITTVPKKAHSNVVANRSLGADATSYIPSRVQCQCSSSTLDTHRIIKYSQHLLKYGTYITYYSGHNSGFRNYVQLIHEPIFIIWRFILLSFQFLTACAITAASWFIYEGACCCNLLYCVLELKFSVMEDRNPQ